MTAAPDVRAQPVTRHRLGRAERSAAIVVAASRAFAEGGYVATSMSDIARAAGVSHPIVYRHFESKDAVYEAILEGARVRLAAALSAADASGRYGPTPAALLAAARADTDAFRVLWRYAVREPDFAHYADAARRELLRSTTIALEPIVAREHLRWAARAMVAYVVEAVLVWIEDGDARLDRRFVAATDAALHAGVRSWAKLPGSGGRA